MNIRRSVILLLLGLVYLPVTSSFNSASEIIVEKSANAQIEVTERWQTAKLEETDITFKAFSTALKGYQNLKAEFGDAVSNRLVIVDFSLPSDRERMIVYDVEYNALAYSSLVAHGRNSGEHNATKFSNIVSSYQSSLGFYRTAETYHGKHGYSLRLDGLENGFNHKARERAIVIHGADYATRDFIDKHGRLGRSFGCPSLPPEVSADIIDYIKDGSILFIYADQSNYLEQSTVING